MKMRTGSIGEICTREVAVAPRDISVMAAAQLMRHHHVGTLVICEQLNGGLRMPVGIVTQIGQSCATSPISRDAVADDSQATRAAGAAKEKGHRACAGAETGDADE